MKPPITVQTTPALNFRNHHMLTAALMDTLRELRAAGIRHVGMTEDEAYQVMTDTDPYHREGGR